VKDLAEGEIITPDAVRRIRPGFGLKPKYYDEIIGKRTRLSVRRNTPVRWEDVNEK
jgi:N-acetylneuraminate synthase